MLTNDDEFDFKATDKLFILDIKQLKEKEYIVTIKTNDDSFNSYEISYKDTKFKYW